ncbi:MAG: mandelate racemase/muconate lactonizing enzyme family protein [Proteobacteria bacterium]|nr:mandelate racemase/muconate lactonizing enzyme family protein [Pseudomonadota bacterium]
MKITAVDTILITIPFDSGAPSAVIAGRPRTSVDILFVRLATDAGVTGWGEAFGHSVTPGTKATIDALIAPLLIGRDAREHTVLIRELQQKLHNFGRNGPVVFGLSGVDIALWDIAGKAAGQPLYRLFGGAPRTTLPAYASLLRYGEPALVARNAARAVERGYRHVKLHEIDVPQVAAARQAIGPEVALMVDVNCPWTLRQALDMAERFRPFDLTWLEEPVWPPEDHESLAAVRRTGTRIAAGENAGGLHDFRHQFAAGALDIAQPSVTKIGGITEQRKIIALAEAFGVTAIPHSAYFGPGMLASVHVVAAMAQETLVERLFMDLAACPFGGLTTAVDGRMPVPQGPGLGCDPDPAVIEKYRVG